MSIQSILSRVKSNPLFFVKSLLRSGFTSVNRALTMVTAYNVGAAEGVDNIDRALIPFTFLLGLPAYYKEKKPQSILRVIMTSVARAISTANVKHVISLAIRLSDWKRLGILVVGYIANGIIYYEPPAHPSPSCSMQMIKRGLTAHLTGMARIATINSLYSLFAGVGFDGLDLGIFMGTLLVSGFSSYKPGSIYRSSLRALMTSCNRGFSMVLLRHLLPSLGERVDRTLLILFVVAFSISFPIYMDDIEKDNRQDQSEIISTVHTPGMDSAGTDEESPLITEDNQSASPG